VGEKHFLQTLFHDRCCVGENPHFAHVVSFLLLYGEKLERHFVANVISVSLLCGEKSLV
jgi:hypothetical protein